MKSISNENAYLSASVNLTQCNAAFRRHGTILQNDLHNGSSSYFFRLFNFFSKSLVKPTYPCLTKSKSESFIFDELKRKGLLKEHHGASLSWVQVLFFKF